jgi:hypothetical protein
MGKDYNADILFVGSQKGINLYEHTYIGGKITMKRILEKYVGMVFLHSSGSG